MPSSTSCVEYATSSAQSMTCASRHRRPGGEARRSHRKTSVSSAYTPNLRTPARRCHGYLQVASSVARVRFSPAPSTLASRRVRTRSVCALPSKPPHGWATASSAASPLCPNGGCPMSCASPATSTTSGSQPRRAPISRAIWATSSEWVSRVRRKSSEPAVCTWVLVASRRNPAECSTRARSRWYGVRPYPLSLAGSGTHRWASAVMISTLGPPRAEHAELVALRVGEQHPRHVTLADVDRAGAHPDQPFHLGLLVVRAQVQVQPVLADLGVHTDAEQQPG